MEAGGQGGPQGAHVAGVGGGGARKEGAGGGDGPGVQQMQMRIGGPAAQSPEISHTGNTHGKECIYVGT